MSISTTRYVGQFSLCEFERDCSVGVHVDEIDPETGRWGVGLCVLTSTGEEVVIALDGNETNQLADALTTAVGHFDLPLDTSCSGADAVNGDVRLAATRAPVPA
jgi:hypothetical protein